MLGKKMKPQKRLTPVATKKKKEQHHGGARSEQEYKGILSLLFAP